MNAMFTKEEATKERIAANVAALEREREGYDARIRGVEAGHDDRLSIDTLKVRIKDVDAEIARLKKLKPSRPSDDGE